MDGEFIRILGRSGERKREGESRRAEANRENRKDRQEIGGPMIGEPIEKRRVERL